MANHRRHFASLAEFVDEAVKPIPGKPDYDRPSHAKSHRDNWAGTKNLAAAAQLAHGWNEGADRLKRSRARINVKGARYRQEAVMSVKGPGTLSMGRYLNGHPEPYVNLRNTQEVKKGQGKVIHLVVNIIASGMVDPEAIERRGGAILSLLAALEGAGRRVRITVLYKGGRCIRRGKEWVSSPEDNVTFTINAKGAGEKTNYNTLAFALAHPSMLRRLGFATREQMIPLDEWSKWGVANTGLMPTDCAEEFPDALYLGCMHGDDRDWNSDQSAADWVTETAAKYGVRLS